MSILSLRIPESFHRELRELASNEGVSINQLINSAVGEKLASLKTMEYMRERAARGSRRAFLHVLAKATDFAPAETDRVPSPGRTKQRAAARKRRR